MNGRNLDRLLVAAGALVLVLSLYAAVATGWHAWSLSQHIHAGKLAQQTRKVPAAAPSLYLVEAGSHGAAGAALLARLRNSARVAGVSLERAEPRAADPADPHSVKISAQASGRSRDIAAFLHAIEAKPPALVIERARLDTDKKGQVSLDILVAARARYTAPAPGAAP